MTMMTLDKGGIIAEQDPKVHSELNPFGSFEANKIGFDLTKFSGKCIKCMLPPVLFDTPVGDYKVIMPVRDAEQVLLSRVEAFKMKKFPINFDTQIEQIERQYRFIRFIINARPDMQLLEIPYDDYFQKTDKVIEDIATFVGKDFNAVEAKKAIDPTYYKIRTKAEVIASLAQPLSTLGVTAHPAETNTLGDAI